jgi:hypothetical protein
VFRFVVGSGTPASDALQDQFVKAHMDELFAIDGIVLGGGSGLCCFEDKPDPGESCVVFALRLCATPLAEFIDKLQAIQARDKSVADRSLRVSVELQGDTGPRCAPEAADCGPVPYEPTKAPAVPESRTPVDPFPSDAKACAYDGECVINGCGNECDHWTRGGMAGTCPYLTNLEDAFCGCVQERCAWFH